MSMRPGLTKIVTLPPGGGQPLSLSHLGHADAPTYSFTTPGGCDQLSTVLHKPARVRSEALNPGRKVYAYRGGSVVWAGILDEPQPTDQGWNITAHGAGTYGADYRSVYTLPWGTVIPDNAVNSAISRGLDWVNPGIGSPSGMWMGQKVDSGSQSITDLLNQITSKGGLTWQVVTGPGGNRLNVYALPTTPNRILYSTAPVGQSIASGPDVIYIRYQATADKNNHPATYGLTSVSQQSVINAQGRREDYMDLSSAGVQSSAAAQGVGTSVLQRFTRAGFTDAIPARRGALLNMGGVPCDPGIFYQDGAMHMYLRVLLADFAFAGEVARGPVQFLVGAYEWNDATMTAAITPFESVRHDFASLMQIAADTDHPRSRPTHKKKKGR